MELVTKCGIKFSSTKRPKTWVKHYDTSKNHIIWSVENSLKMIGTDRFEALLIHRPDPLLNPTEVAEAFSQLRQEGKLLHFGVSNFTPSQFTMLQSFLSFPLITNQLEISLSRVDSLFNGDLDLLMQHKTSAMAWSPLGGGKLMANERELFSKASKYNASYRQLSLAWLLKHPSTIFPVIGTTTCLSLRQFERQCKLRIGMPPKFFARIVRFSKAYRLREQFVQMSWTKIAYECGYFDQLHFIRDFKEFAGVTPRILEKELAHLPIRLQGPMQL